ncbi:LOW QUALITY PROTEIN: hypothetical protein CFOL_v3_34831, partial [Cephalotus follicularis]
GGSLLYVPAGIWLTWSFNLTSHFTLYLDKDAVLLASQVSNYLGLGFSSIFVFIMIHCYVINQLKWVFWMTGNYGDHPDNNIDPNALPVIKNINYRDMIAKNVTMAAILEGIAGDPFTEICISNVTIGLSKKPHKLQWNCTDVAGISSDMTPPCALLPDQG